MSQARSLASLCFHFGRFTFRPICVCICAGDRARPPAVDLVCASQPGAITSQIPVLSVKEPLYKGGTKKGGEPPRGQHEPGA